MADSSTAPQQLFARLLQLRAEAAAQQQIVVLATGVFDVVHEEHRTFLEKAKAAGDVLVVGVESDVRVRALKGEGRPVNSATARIQNLKHLGFIDHLFVLPEDFHLKERREQLIDSLRPKVLAVSSHSPFLDQKRQMMQQFGGKVVVVHKHNPAISTTLLLEQAASVNLG